MMATKDPLAAPGRLMKIVMEYRTTKKEREAFAKQENKIKEQLKGYVTRHGSQDADGHFWVELDEVVALPGTKPFNAIKNERHSGETADEEEAWRICEAKGIEEEVFDLTPVLNLDKLEEAFKRKKITYAEYRKIMKQWENYHFVLAQVE